MDHFICSDYLVYNTQSVDILVDGDNTSDHYAIAVDIPRHDHCHGSSSHRKPLLSCQTIWQVDGGVAGSSDSSCWSSRCCCWRSQRAAVRLSHVWQTVYTGRATRQSTATKDVTDAIVGILINKRQVCGAIKRLKSTELPQRDLLSVLLFILGFLCMFIKFDRILCPCFIPL